MDALPVSALVSQAAVAFVMEYDALFEQRMPHSTTTQNGAGLTGVGPWLVSRAMWSGCLRFVSPDDSGTSVDAVRERARVSPNEIRSLLNHLGWWGYVSVEKKCVRLTEWGRQAAAVWAPLGDEVEGRWRRRFGDTAIDSLRTALAAVADPAMPSWLPVVEYQHGLRMQIEPMASPDDQPVDIGGLLARTVNTVTAPFEGTSTLSRPVAANVLRVLDVPIATRDLPMGAGVSKEATAASLKILERAGLVTACAPPEGSKGKGVALGAGGLVARAETLELIARLDSSLLEPRARRSSGDLRSALEAVTGSASFADGLRPPEDSWRWTKPYAAQTEAWLDDPSRLPWHPMVLHRGGFPAGE